MEKQKADQVITDYLQKIYGFAVKKSFSYNEAEDLSSEIILEVYRSLLKSDEIFNLEGYIWRISEHTYARYVATKKNKEGLSIDGMEIPYYEDFLLDDDSEDEKRRLRREISFLSEIRRKIVYLFYYKSKSVLSISRELSVPEGTVKWHLNKARSELKEGFTMERKIGTLGMYPIEATSFGHSGTPGKKGDTQYYLGDKINLNIVYSVYHTPRTKEEIAEELGLTPVYIDDKISMLESNGFLVKTKGDKYTTYVKFDAEKYSLELLENKMQKRLEIAKILAKEYAPLVREAIADVDDAYIPSGNRELLEAAAIFYGVVHRCSINAKNDLSKYKIKTTDGGRFIALVHINSEISDPDYEPKLKDLPEYWACGDMDRWSHKYPTVHSWSIDTRLCSRKGYWEDNLTSDYEYLYELITGQISDNSANADKFKRLRERKFITQDGKPNIMVVKGSEKSFFSRIPKLDDAIKDKFADIALEYAMIEAKSYPPQMQDIVVNWGVCGFIGTTVALMVMDILYSDGTFKALEEDEKVTSNLIMFSDELPNA